MKAKYGKDKLTVKTGIIAKIDFKNSVLYANGKTYSIDPVGEATQELIVTGGLEELVKKEFKRKQVD